MHYKNIIAISDPSRFQAAPQTVEANADSQCLLEVFCMAVVVMWWSLVFGFPCSEGGTIRLRSQRCIS